MYFTKEYITGMPLNLKKHLLGTIKQPIVDYFMYDYDFIDFIKPYYMGMTLSFENEIKKEGIYFTYFLKMMENEPKIMNSFYHSLTLLYETTLDDIKFFEDKDEGLVLMINKKDGDETKPVAFISDKNFIVLCEIVLEMCNFEKPQPEGEIKGDAELVERFKEKRREYFKNKKNEDGILFENIVRDVMIFKNILFYDDIKNLTIWKLRDYYTVECIKDSDWKQWLMVGNGKMKAKQIKSWQQITKLKKNN